MNTFTVIKPCPGNHERFHARWAYICRAEGHEGARVIELTPAGSMVKGSWICRTCGTDHGGEPPGEPHDYDVDYVQFYTIEGGGDLNAAAEDR